MARSVTWRNTLPGFSRILLRFWPLVRAQRRLVFASAAAMLVQVVFRVLEPWPLKYVFDRLLGADGSSSLEPRWIAAIDSERLLLACGVATLALVGCRAVCGYAASVGFALVGNRVLTRVREDLFRHVQKLSLRFHAAARTGDLVVRMIGDVGLVREVAVTAMLPLLISLLLLIGMVAVMLFMDWRLALVALLPMPLLLFFTGRQSRRIQQVGRRQRQRESDLATTAAESVGTIQEVQALSLQEAFAQQFAAASQRDLKQGVRGKRLSAGLERGVDLLVGVSTALVLWLGGTQALGGAITPGDLVVFLSYQRRAFSPIRDLAKYSARLAKATSAGERILELLDRAPEVSSAADAIPAPPLTGGIEFQNVNFGWEAGKPVLCDLSFAVAPCESVAIVGESGAGKSTLLRLLLRLCDPDSGRICIGGRDTLGYELESLRRQLGVVLPDAVLFAASIRENIAWAAPDATREQVEGAALRARVFDFASAWPEGLDTPVGEVGATLSRGQRQRIAIARGIVRDTPILLLDEPMSGLDANNASEVTLALESAMLGRTCLLVTHDLASAARCDRIIVLANGAAAESGTHRELLLRNGHYASLWRRQRAAGRPESPGDETHAVCA